MRGRRTGTGRRDPQRGERRGVAELPTVFRDGIPLLRPALDGASWEGPPLCFSHPACLEHETGEHPERAARIQAIRRASIRRQRGWLGYERREAPAAALDALTAVHGERYVEEVRSKSASRRSLDGETVLSPGTL